MSRKRTVWGVTRGEYSDYRVVVLFASQKAADEHVVKGGGDETQQFVLIEEGAPKRLVRWNAHYHEIDDADGVTFTSDLVWEYEDHVPPVRPKVTDGENARGQFWVNATARSRQGAVKACADRVAAIKARRAGVS